MENIEICPLEDAAREVVENGRLKPAVPPPNEEQLLRAIEDKAAMQAALELAAVLDAAKKRMEK